MRRPSRDRISPTRFRLAQQTQCREPPIPFQNDQLAALRVRVVHNDQRLDIEISVRGNRLEQLIELGGPVQAGDYRLIADVVSVAEQPRIAWIQPKLADGNLRGCLKLHRTHIQFLAPSQSGHLPDSGAEPADGLDRDAAASSEPLSRWPWLFGVGTGVSRDTRRRGATIQIAGWPFSSMSRCRPRYSQGKLRIGRSKNRVFMSPLVYRSDRTRTKREGHQTAGSPGRGGGSFRIRAR